MKKSIIVLSLVLWAFAAHNLQAQEGCTVSIAPSTMPLCQMTNYPGARPVETGETDCLRAFMPLFLPFPTKFGK
jgi:hypothetical protein